MFKRILVGLDGTSHGLRTAAAAAGLAGRFGAELHVLTVAKRHEVTPAVQDYLEAENLLGEPSYVLDEETQTIVDKAKVIAEQNKVRKIRTVVREGRPAVVLSTTRRTTRWTSSWWDRGGWARSRRRCSAACRRR